MPSAETVAWVAANVKVTAPIQPGSVIVLSEPPDVPVDSYLACLQDLRRHLSEYIGHDQFGLVYLPAGGGFEVVNPEEWLPKLAEVLRPLVKAMITEETG